MRTGIIGIGGVGGYFGGKLAREYANSREHEIIFIARGDHLEAIRENGLRLITPEEEYVVRPNLVTNRPEEVSKLDLIFFCTKSYALENAAAQFSSCVKKGSVVIPLLNGVNNAQRLRRILPAADILSGSVYLISHIDKPGIVRQEGGIGQLIFGTDNTESSKKYSHILNFLLKAKINAILTDKISEVLWTKYLLMCPIGSLTSMTGRTYGGIWEDVLLRKKAKDMMMEVVAVAKSQNIHLSSDAVDKAMEMIASFGYHSKTSMQLDFEKGRPTEMDTLTAYLCQVGKESGVPTPLHDEVYTTLKLKHIVRN